MPGQPRQTAENVGLPNRVLWSLATGPAGRFFGFLCAEQVPRRAPPAAVHDQGGLPGGVLHLRRLPRLPRDVRGGRKGLSHQIFSGLSRRGARLEYAIVRKGLATRCAAGLLLSNHVPSYLLGDAAS